MHIEYKVHTKYEPSQMIKVTYFRQLYIGFFQDCSMRDEVILFNLKNSPQVSLLKLCWQPSKPPAINNSSFNEVKDDENRGVPVYEIIMGRE